MELMARGRVWVVVGGADSGGIIVRTGKELSSQVFADRLSFGALVEEVSLSGGRLQFRALVGHGPQEGWVSTKLKTRDLVVRTLPEHLSSGRSLGENFEDPPAMTFYAISDVHVERKENMNWLNLLPSFEQSTLLVAGDVGVSLCQIEDALTIFKSKFDHVFYCYGNHETWAKVHLQADKDIASYNDSFQKLRALQSLCERLQIHTGPELIEGVWVVPVLGWYHSEWDTEPDLQAPTGKKLDREPIPAELLATDAHACIWGSAQNGSRELASILDRQNELWGNWPLPVPLLENLKAPRGTRKHHVISFSHFLPRIELMPEKRFLFHPNLAKIVGSEFIQRRLDVLQADLHVFGHSHFPWDMTLDGVRYRSWPLGTPEEQARRIASVPLEFVEQWHPLPVFDSDGNHYRSNESCWFSLMYTRIPREPFSSKMAPHVAAGYCKSATLVPDAIISPPGCLDVSTKEERQRREKFGSKGSASVVREIRRSM